MHMTEELFGVYPNGQKIKMYSIANFLGLSIKIITYGATLQSAIIPDRIGNRDEISLGFDTLDGYLENHAYFGATIGRFANRIAKGIFSLDGITYRLACNENGKNHLHGGNFGFDKKVWSAQPLLSQGSAGVRLSYVSADGEEGYPGNLNVSVTYSLNESNELAIEYTAVTDKPTPINLTNHAYWNLSGAGSGTIFNHDLLLNCLSYLPIDEDSIPTGEIKSVAGTPMDFTISKPIGRDMLNGYDHCFVIKKDATDLALAACLFDPQSGRGMEVHTTMPGIQVYTGNFLAGIRGSGGMVYERYGGLCLETEFFPDAPNKICFFIAILRPGEIYHHKTIHRFFIR